MVFSFLFFSFVFVLFSCIITKTNRRAASNKYMNQALSTTSSLSVQCYDAISIIIRVESWRCLAYRTSRQAISMNRKVFTAVSRIRNTIIIVDILTDESFDKRIESLLQLGVLSTHQNHFYGCVNNHIFLYQRI